MDTYRNVVLPYWGSDLVLGAEETRHISSVDTDGTMANKSLSDGEPTAAELKDRAEAMKLLEEGGRPVIQSTARTPELGMSSTKLGASREHGVLRPEPHMIDENGQPLVAPELSRKFDSCLDSHAFCGLGTGIYLRHTSLFYVPDTEYTKMLDNWHDDALEFLYHIDAMDPERPKHWLIDALADIEQKENYHTGKTDVYPLEYRIQLEWMVERHGKSAAEEKNRAKKRIRFWQHLFRPLKNWDSGAKRIDIIDESNPRRGRYVIYLVPRRSSKEHMLNHVIRKVAETGNLVPSQFSAFVAGDTMTDLRAGFYGGAGAGITFLLAGGSRLAPYLSPDGEFAGRPHAGEKLRHFTRVLRDNRTECKGIYEFITPGVDKVPRRFIVADEAFEGEIGPASIAAALEYLKKNRNSHLYAIPHRS